MSAECDLAVQAVAVDGDARQVDEVALAWAAAKKGISFTNLKASNINVKNSSFAHLRISQ